MSHRSSLVCLILGAALSFALAACGPGGNQNETDVVVAPPDADAGPRCDAGQTVCSGECVDLQSSIHHCGQCGNSCGSGGFICSSGECQCIESGHTNCDGKCLDLQTDSQNCGACGNACAGGERCEKGSCKTLTDIESVVEETNRIRDMGYDCDSKGNKPPASPVEGNGELHKAAQGYAETMAQNSFLSHTYPPPDCDPNADDGCHDFVWRIGQTDYQGTPVGENIARGQKTPQEVVNGWAESDGHCAIMLSQEANEIGIGKATSPSGTIYWVQVYGQQ